MKIKSLIFLALFLILAALSLTQFNLVSAANQAPVTPITYFTYNLKGKIVYRLFDRLFPATNIKVTARNQDSGEIFSARTDLSGFYTITVKQAVFAALYVVKPHDGQETKWEPEKYKGMVSKDINRLNFVGTKASSSGQISN